MAKTKLKMYISGPMGGVENYNVKLFDRVAKEMEEVGFEVHNPADYAKRWMEQNGKRDMTDEEYGEAMLHSLNNLKTCDVILMLPKWQYSKGAKNELMLALVRGMEVKIYGSKN